jgi:predicted amidohydrolase YtcJ
MRNFLPLLLLINACTYQQMDADLIIHNATIITVDENNTVAEAMAVKDGKILEIGPEREILNKYRSTQKIDAQKQFVYPGFIDAHCHFLGYGQFLNNVNLVGSKSFEEVIERLKSRKTEGVWIIGRGWDQNDWQNKTFPNKAELDKIFPDVPVYLTRIDGHAALANSKALEMAGITASSQIEGGLIVLENGEPTGLVVDRAMELIETIMPTDSAVEIEKALLRAQTNCFAAGITSVSDAGLSTTVVKIIQQLQDAGNLLMNMYVMLSPDENTEVFLKNGVQLTDKLSVRSVKLYGDGALGSRGAALLQPYSDDTTNNGLILYPKDYFEKWAALCKKHGFQLNTHCIGDSAGRMVLDIYGQHLEGSNDLRWRIEHAQIVHPDDISKYGQFNILPSVQPTHATSDMYWAGERLGAERVKTAYAFEELRKQNGMIPLGTDFPIEDIDPIKTFFSAVFRKDAKGFPEGGFQIENAMSRQDALRGMTIWAAISNFEEEKRGSLEPGKQADIVILNRNLLDVPEEQFKNIEVQYTFVDGKQVYPNVK